MFFSIESINNQLRKLEFPGIVKCVIYDKLYTISKLDIVEMHLSFGIKPIYLIAGQIYKLCRDRLNKFYNENKQNNEKFVDDCTNFVDQIENIEGDFNILERHKRYTQRCYFSTLVKRLPSVIINDDELLNAIKDMTNKFTTQPIDYIGLEKSKLNFAEKLLQFHLNRNIDINNETTFDSILILQKEGKFVITKNGELLRTDGSVIVDNRLGDIEKQELNKRFIAWKNKHTKQYPNWYAEAASFDEYITDSYGLKNRENTYMPELVRFFARHFGVYNKNLFVSYQPPLIKEAITNIKELPIKPDYDFETSKSTPINEKIEDIKQIDNIVKLLELYIEKTIDKKLDELTSPNNK